MPGMQGDIVDATHLTAPTFSMGAVSLGDAVG